MKCWSCTWEFHQQIRPKDLEDLFIRTATVLVTTVGWRNGRGCPSPSDQEAWRSQPDVQTWTKGYCTAHGAWMGPGSLAHWHIFVSRVDVKTGRQLKNDDFQFIGDQWEIKPGLTLVGQVG